MVCMVKWLNVVMLHRRVKGFKMLVISFLGPRSESSGLQWEGPSYFSHRSSKNLVLALPAIHLTLAVLKDK